MILQSKINKAIRQFMNTELKNIETSKLGDNVTIRNTSQYLMPISITGSTKLGNAYHIYPTHALGNDKIFNGFDSLAQWIIQEKTVVIDGYVGVFWNKIQAALHHYFTIARVSVKWILTEQFIKSTSDIDALVRPFLGDFDAVWGTKCSLSLNDFYHQDKLEMELPDNSYDLNIVMGTGAVLSNWNVPVLYIDLPKNELQFRMRAGSIFNLGSDRIKAPSYMYKRFYFVDWVLLNKHKKSILDKITIIADGQWPDNINWMYGDTLKKGLLKLSESVLRVRPWFEPGAWGGQWLKHHIPAINQNVVNYAWSFELIVPENGLVFESNGFLLEVSFDFIMFHNKDAILGRHASTFGDEFPIRFDFLDTFNGGNLSIQCHPSQQYIQEQFGEKITQDETYYILDCQDNAQVYMGFQEDINPDGFKQALLLSQEKGIQVNIDEYVQLHPSHKHDLFLIPNGTVHSAGAGNLVLEISATPYIFTFKMYDWMRMDLDGQPRPINIDHAFKNLRFERKGNKVTEELISKPIQIDQGADWQLIHLPTHQEHFYDIHRIEFENEVHIQTNDVCHILMLVEGATISFQSADGTISTFHYAETFVVPAAAKNYTLINTGNRKAKVVKAFVKENFQFSNQIKED